MALVTFVALVLVLATGLVPVWLLRHAPKRQARDYLVAAQPTRLGVVRNASIAYALRMVAFVPIFTWGASGDLLPAVIALACFALGTWLVYVARRPLLEFLDDALASDGSVTVHEFVASAHGNNPRVRLLAAGLTLCALFGLVVGEVLAAAAFLRPMLGASATFAALLMLGAMLSIAATAALSGHSGIMHSAQLQLGILYFGLFGATALVLYLHVSARTPLPPHSTVALAFTAVFAVIVLWYRRSRYVDNDPIRGDGGAAHTGGSRLARALARFGKILNVGLSALLVLIAFLALMDLHAADASMLERNSIAALAVETRISGVGLVALGLLALFYPLVDVTNWLKLAATRRSAGAGGEADRGPLALRGVFAVYAVETTLVGLLVWAFGAIATVALAPARATDVLEAFAARLGAADNMVAAIAGALLAIAVFAAALSTLSALLGASLCTLRYDFMAPLGRIAVQGEASASREAKARRHALVAGVVGLGAAFAAAAVANSSLRIGFASTTLPALLSVLSCAQLVFMPLVFGPIVSRVRRKHRTLGPSWAVAILAVGVSCGIAAVSGYLATGIDAWLWSAAPVSLGSGFVLLAIGHALSSWKS